MHLLQHLVHIGGITLLPAALPLLAVLFLGLGDGLFGAFLRHPAQIYKDQG